VYPVPHPSGLKRESKPPEDRRLRKASLDEPHPMIQGIWNVEQLPSKHRLSVPLSSRSSLVLPLHTIGASIAIARSRVASTSALGCRAKPSDEDYSISQNSLPHIPPRPALKINQFNHQTQRRRVPYKEPRFWQETHIRSLPPTARFVSGVSTPAVAPRSATLRRWLEMAPGLLAVDAFWGVGRPAVAAFVPAA